MTQTLIFDTETTGKNNPVIIEAAWLKLESISPFKTSDSFNQRYNPEKPIDLGALATHHILDEELIDCPLASSFKLPEDAEYLIGHNIDYDWNVIGQPNIKRICTLALARKAWPQLDSHNQSALLYYLDRTNARAKLKNAHSALADVNICSTILKSLCEVFNISSVENLYEVSEISRTPTHMPFGKYKGTSIINIPKDYKSWLLSQDNLDAYLRSALSDEQSK
jgi:exodeoxyribonuclease X